MGWNSWCTGDGLFKPSLCNALGDDPCSENEVKSIADALIEQGMDKLGYEYVVLDDCWSTKERDQDGKLQVDKNRFPSGMSNLSAYVHAKQLKLGLYTSVGDVTCKGNRPGSFDHYEIDAKTMAEWNIDFVKMDHCGNKGNFTDQELYGRMSKALNETGRPILFSLCSWGESEVWKWGGQIAQMFRIQEDHLPFWSWPHPGGDEEGYGQGTKEIIEWMAALSPSKWSGEYSIMGTSPHTRSRVDRCVRPFVSRSHTSRAPPHPPTSSFYSFQIQISL